MHGTARKEEGNRDKRVRYKLLQCGEQMGGYTDTPLGNYQLVEEAFSFFEKDGLIRVPHDHSSCSITPCPVNPGDL